MTWNSIKSMRKIFKNILFLKAVKTNKNIAIFSLYPFSKKGRLLLLIPENTGDRVPCVLNLNTK